MCFLFWLLVPAEADGQNARAKITQLVGNVEVRSKASAAWRGARIGMTVKAHWDIRSYLESEAEVTFETGTKVKIGENSVITLSRLLKDDGGRTSKSTVKVMTGKVWANVKKITNTRSEFDFETPTAVASIRGTRLGIDVVKRRTLVDVYEGAVAVRKVGEKRAVKVTTFMRAVVEKDKKTIDVVPFKKVKKGIKKGKNSPFYDPYAESEPKADSATVPQSTDTTDTPGGRSDSTGTDTLGQNEAPAEDAELVLLISAPEQNTVLEKTPVQLKGTCTPGAKVTVDGGAADVAADGSFSKTVDLKPGKNSIVVTGEKNGVQQSQTVVCEYHVPLRLQVNNLEDAMEVTSKTIQLSVNVSEGAHWSVNGIPGAREVQLQEGANTITVEAWDEWGNRKTETYQVTLASTMKFVLRVATPADGATITQPFIQVTGSTKAEANVFVNDIQAVVGRDGFFSARLPIPDEPYSYSVEIVAQYGGDELTETRTVTYAPPEEKLFLDCSSPIDGQDITSRTVRVNGKTVPHAEVTANDIPVPVAVNGVFSREIPISEKNIGEYQLEITARNEVDEISKMFLLNISGSSPAINTSIPVCIVSQLGLQATTQRALTLQFLDRTPDEELELTFVNNGSSEVTATEPGRSESISLNEGKNEYSVQVEDRAGNSSPVIRGKIYYLPGPMILNLNEPPSNPMVYEGLPPVLHPGYNVREEPVDVEVEIDDGIGTVPESIRYCRVTGNGETILLRNNNDYIFVGKVNVRRGKNQFIAQAEDLGGRLETLRFEIIVR
jgi:hypothetical protein